MTELKGREQRAVVRGLGLHNRRIGKYQDVLFSLIDQYAANNGGIIDETLVGYYSALADGVAILERDGLVETKITKRLWPLKDVEYRKLKYGVWKDIRARLTE